MALSANHRTTKIEANKVKDNTPLTRHPWKAWFKRKKFTLTRGVDFNCQVHSMGVQIRQAAVRFDISVAVFIDEDTITVVKK